MKNANKIDKAIKKFNNYKEVAVFLLGVIMAALNIWLSYQLSPIKDGIEQNAYAIERQEMCSENIGKEITEIKEDVKDTNDKVQKIFELHFRVN